MKQYSAIVAQIDGLNLQHSFEITFGWDVLEYNGAGVDQPRAEAIEKAIEIYNERYR